MIFSGKFGFSFKDHAIFLFHTFFILAFLIAAKYVYWIYVALSVLVGGYYCIRKDPQFIPYLLWLYYLSPFYRRVFDYYVGRTDESVILIVPVIVSIMPIYWLLTSKFKASITVSIAMILAVYFYAFMHTAGSKSSLLVGAYDLLNYLGPILIYCFILGLDYTREQLVGLVKRSCVVFLLVCGAYGVFQFAYLPAWDEAWLKTAKISSVGDAVAGDFRIFSTLNSPGPYAYALAFGMMFSIYHSRFKRFFEILSVAVAFLAFLITRVRSAWLMFIVSIVFGIKKIPAKIIFGGTVILGCVVMIGLTFLSSFELSDKIIQRLDSITQVSGDRSFLVRLGHYSEFVNRMIEYPMGMGFGLQRYGVAISDDGLNTKFGQFGPIWGLAFYCSIYWLVFLSWKNSRSEIGLKSVLVGMLAIEFFSNAFTSLVGIHLFLLLALMMKNPQKRNYEAHT